MLCKGEILMGFNRAALEVFFPKPTTYLLIRKAAELSTRFLTLLEKAIAERVDLMCACTVAYTKGRWERGHGCTLVFCDRFSCCERRGQKWCELAVRSFFLQS